MNVLGLDISSTICGVVILNKELELLYQEPIKFKQGQTIWEKMEIVEQTFEEINEKYKIDYISLESKLLTHSFTTATTIAKLVEINSLVTYVARKIFKVKSREYNVLTARKLIGFSKKYKRKDIPKDGTKLKIVEFISETFKTFKVFEKLNKRTKQYEMDTAVYDVADALVIAYAFFCDKDYEERIRQAKKEKERKRKKEKDEKLLKSLFTIDNNRSGLKKEKFLNKKKK